MATLTVFMLVTMTPVFVQDVTSMDEVMIDFTVLPAAYSLLPIFPILPDSACLARAPSG